MLFEREEAEVSDEVPEVDAEEQRTPVWPPAQAGPASGRPIEAPEADYLEQRSPLLGGEGDSLPSSDPEASEADLLEQAGALPGDDEEEYPPGSGSATGE